MSAAGLLLGALHARMRTVQPAPLALLSALVQILGFSVKRS